ncbi:M3 family metallopeptidase [Amylibacter sp. IMCC11727]|uniref:M3 family metallopeptidase n=1 Tax=Amylibacter sp. IMCC11727 TaxID=3039851 RepID=UPI00244E241B|nr:M3 family metallopeptidase [Amylibacter sp. IMCC11727]WGI21577.1 M3 family metallopeptidase [Amylibacter sp. IMCC11727]
MTTQNPFLTDWSTPFELPPFDLIKDEHFAPAFDAAFEQSRAAINAIADNASAPTYANTIDALETADALMDKVAGVFFNISGSDSNDARQALQRDLAPRFAAFNSETMMNEALFKRIKHLNENRDGNTAEQNRVLDLYHRMFVRAGANLTGDAKKRLPEVTARLAELGTAFTQNLLKDEADWYMELGPQDLDGLPDFLLSAAAETAKERGIDGHIITLSRSLIVPFLQFSTRRDLREKAYIAWDKRGENGGDTDNTGIAKETLDLRYERANLLGYKSFSDFKLEPEMAKTPENVRDLLMAVWEPAKAAANADAERLTEMLNADGINGDLEPWDWRYYAEKRRAAEYDLDEAELKPYFQLDQMIEAAFDCANRLFGLTFKELDVPLYHPDARAWEVKKGDRHMAVFIGDYFARSSKRSGAWCSRFRGQQNLGKDIRPITVNICNFAKAPAGQPSLLTFDDARTLFHEFGHALHSMLSDVHYAMISGTSVARDFVELPSQLYEHWLSVPSVLEKYARHADTGEPMPKDLLDKLLAAENYDMGFATVEYTASALVDLAFHEGEPPADPMAKQAEVLASLDMPQAIRMRHATPHFAHVFSGDGYSSGYYSYMWSEVMDADAFEAFEETGDPFDAGMAAKLHDNIYSAGGSEEGEALYQAFRGSLPKVDALLKGRGLDSAA